MSVVSFAGTPITKTFFIVTTLATLVILSNKSQHAISLDASRVFGQEREWWRVIASMLPMATAWELLVALQLIWSFRVFERFMGSAKFGSFLVLTAFLGKSLELALCIQFPRLRPPSGPLAILAALSTMYYGYIPSTAKPYLAAGDLRTTEKVITYMSSLVLALQRSWSSFMPCACGVLVALLYCSSVLPLQSFRVPGRPLFAVSAMVLGNLFRSNDQLALRRMRMASLQQRNRMGAAQRAPEERLLPPESVAGTGPRLRHRAELPPPPSEEDIELLMGLGFDRNTVIQVLRSSGNNKEAAANTLLGH